MNKQFNLAALLLFTLLCCVPETDNLIKTESKKSSLFKSIDFNTFKNQIKNKDIENYAINSLINKQIVDINQLQYSTESENYVVEIDTSEVLIVEKDGITSYTFKTQTTDMSKTTNYVLAHDDENVEEIYITYEDDGSGKIIDPESGYEVTTESSDIWCPVATVYYVCGYCGRNDCDYQPEWITVINYEPCPTWNPEEGGGGTGTGSGGGGNSDGDGTSGGSGDSTGGGNDLPLDGGIITKPLPNMPPSDECQELVKNEQDPTFNQHMQTLKNNVSNGNLEKGFAVLYQPATATQFENETYVDPNGIIFGNYSSVNVPNSPNKKAEGHNHLAQNPKSLKIFSPGDLAKFGSMLEIQQNDSNSSLTVPQLAFYTVTEGSMPNTTATYALKVIDSTGTLINFSKKFPLTLSDSSGNLIPNSNWDLTYSTNINRYFKKKIKPTKTRTKQIKSFLKFIDKRNLGIELYEKNETTGKWSKVTLENGDVTRTPC